VDEVVALIYSSSNRSLNSLTLKPRFSVREVNVCMRSEEGVERSKLIELNKEIISWFAIEAWNVSTAEGVTGNSKLK